ncbi:ABC transporter permease [Paenibacillus crassostreae]|uniref:Multidrug ABC transporter permease n=1 Tax=Paenibacillus crassostreae TaxID=1763538 RepID=A0A167BC45_9BACL|nr:ABC transporter permease [Paenibacillus crassostreae]AOZ92977.1 multidrug ABC transporter permease [Paenibacillus crassostreae]OAB71934.1 multidrug ABC transporter permease [Paenibacillus crassostreae]
MLPVFMAQWLKDKRKPFTIILFIGLSILATVIFGDTSQYTQTSVAIFSSGPSAEEIEEKWVDLLNDSDAIKFVITEEGKAREEVAEGRSDVAILLLEKDYRLITSSNMVNIQLVEQQVHKVFAQEAQLAAAAGTENTAKLRNEVEIYLENPPLKVQTQSLNGGEIPNHNMGIQLLFGFTLFIVMFTIGFKVNGITADKVNGVWNRLILSPVSKTAMYVGHLFYSFCVGFFQMLIVFLIFEYVMDYDLGNFQMILTIAAVYTLSMVSLAMLFTGIAKTPEKFNMIFSSIVPIIPVISGVYMAPGSISNPILVFIGDIFPLSHAVDAMLDVTLYNAGWSDIALSCSIMLLIGVVCMGVGVNLVERSKR